MTPPPDISVLPIGDAPQALAFPHFPTRHQAVIWRNWNLVPAERLAAVLRCTPREITECAAQMGLRPDTTCLERWRERGFQTLIRRNWELLDYPQLLELLQWTPEQLAFVLKEDDFLLYKLGLHKPRCGDVRFRPLSEEECRRTAELRHTVEKVFDQLPAPLEHPFDFLYRYGHLETAPADGREQDFAYNFIHAYSALYGDALLDDDLSSFPEAMFADYAASGVRGIWIQGVLYALVPWLGDSQPCSRYWQRRLANLDKLVKRAGKHGLEVYLYLNEPRSMPESFFVDHPDWRGVAGDQGDFALCTSAPGVLDALTIGVERLFRAVPGLGGAFTITMAENLTHCRSRWKCCPRCESHSAAELIAGVNCAILKGIRRAGSPGKLIAYTWAWDKEWTAEIVRRQGQDIPLLAVSESQLPTECLGFHSEVCDYSISKVGPSPKTRQVWADAKMAGGECAAKVQINSSWELAAVPYLPVPNLVERHLQNLKETGVRGLMLSWTLGGAPGGNLPLLRCSKETLAVFLFGSEAAPMVLKAWSRFSEAFERFFPFNAVSVLYFAPQNYGPMTLLHPAPSGRRATMIGFPYDDIETWRGAIHNEASRPDNGPMPPEVLRNAFRNLADRWSEGVALLRDIVLPDETRERRNLDELRTIADACRCHFLSAADQIAFVMERDNGHDIMPLVRRERQTALELLALCRRDSRIGFEASNHYFYTENDLLEKILNCDWISSSFARK